MNDLINESFNSSSNCDSHLDEMSLLDDILNLSYWIEAISIPFDLS